MKNKTLALIMPVFAVTLILSPPAQSASQNVDAALALVKQMQPDQCALQKVRGKVLVAHQAHNQAVLDALTPQMDELTARLKPLDDKLHDLTIAIKKNPEEQTAYTAALPEAAKCH